MKILRTLTKAAEHERQSALHDLGWIERACAEHRQRLEKGMSPMGCQNLGYRVSEYLLSASKHSTLLQTIEEVESMAENGEVLGL